MRTVTGRGLVRGLVALTLPPLAFVAAAYLQLRVTGLYPRAHSGQDGIERVPLDLMLRSGLGAAVAVSLALWVVWRERDWRRPHSVI